ncbi:hypothetical protein B0A55_10155 [Friedmanniomyces simplex]|uniref:CoA-transferase family III n=1 Tax=Friedmanniomyces simplex TaxID=329884 RepID=A0A4U0WSJ5_9PEZI|nr:hypothetical protein B0A55_10155 [Friedmanniomyces simplex]
MEVPSLGLGRTGTLSMQEALKILGYPNTYHYSSIFANVQDAHMWNEALRAKYQGHGKPFGRREWDQPLGHCRAITDVPAVCFWRESLEAYPDVKVDLVDRDEDKWYKSCSKLRDLIRTCDVFLQSYRPGALGKRGFGPAELAALKPGIIYANLSAFGTAGPWAGHRGFDSLVQTCSGMNVSEAASSGNVDGQVARPLPCQALDNTSGYFLATGIAAAVYKRAVEGGAWQIDVSLAGTMKFLRSLGQVTPSNDDLLAEGEVPRHYFEEHESAFGTLRAVKHSASIEGAMPGWDSMARPLGSDEPEWL